MSTTIPHKKAKPRRRRILSFSLRGLLLLFTLLPVALWYWWQWSMEVEVVVESNAADIPQVLHDGLSAQDNPFDRSGLADIYTNSFVIYGPPAPPKPGNAVMVDPFDNPSPRTLARKAKGVPIGYYRREVRTVRRWGSNEVIRHGPTRVFNKSGDKVFEGAWLDDLRHGPFKMWDAAGQLRARGEFHRDKQHGKWTVWNSQGNLVSEKEFDRGMRVGHWVDYRAANPVGKKDLEKWYENGQRVKSKSFRYTGGSLRFVQKKIFDKNEQVILDTTQSGDGLVELARREFRDGTGLVIAKHPNGVKKHEFHWTAGKAVGSWHWWNEAGEVNRTVDFEDGFPVRFNGQPVSQLTARLAKAPFEFRRRMAGRTKMMFIKTSLNEAVDYLGDLHRIKFRIHHRASPAGGVDLNRQYSLHETEIPLSLGLVLLLYETEMVCDYRYDQLLITTEEDARIWSDGTGVQDLQPPPGSAWERALAARVGVELDQLTPAKIDELAERFGVKIRLEPDVEETRKSSQWEPEIDQGTRPLRERLQVLLGREKLTCELDGDTLLIKSLEE